MNYDPFQKKAIDAINAGGSVLVSAPTGSGKTAIAEYAIQKAIKNGERAIYTSPVKALSNQKYRDFLHLFGDQQVGILTGDVSINPEAKLLIMTTEIYRNKLFENPKELEQTSWIIFDEFHYLDEPERGTVWEEAIMFTPSHIRILALSATAPNIDELARWMESILHHPIEVIIETKRPVELSHTFQCQGVFYDDLKLLKKEGYLHQDIWPSFQNRFHSPRRHHHSPKRWGTLLKAKPNRIDDLIRHLQESDRLPCLYFAFGRKRVEELAWHHGHFDFLTSEEKNKMQTLYQDLVERYELSAEAKAHDMRQLALKGIAFHHAGMLPTLKEVVERLFTSGLIKLIFTTETFALGINMPARCVVFDELRKFQGTHFGNLSTRDYYQMAGRAGRRGLDEKGYVYVRINPHYISHSALVKIVQSNMESIQSQFNSSYATCLNLYKQLGEKLMTIYPKTLHYFSGSKKGREQGLGALEKKVHLLRRLGYIQNQQLTPKGKLASWLYGYELVLSEMYEQGFLETLTEIPLAILLVSLAFEPRRDQEERIPKKFLFLHKQIQQLLHKIHRAEDAIGIYPHTRIAYFHLASSLEAWMSGTSFDQLQKYTDVDEGEIIRNFRTVIQLLRQLRLAPLSSSRLKETARSAISKINRDIVDAEHILKIE